jgi:hypothetical protein
MNAQHPGFLAGALMGAAGVGAVAGLIPLFLGVRQETTWLAVGGFLASVVGGLAAGIIGAVIVAGIFSCLIRPWDEPAQGDTQTRLGGSKGRSALGWYLVAMFFGQTIFLAVFWSIFMSFWMGKSFMSILVPAGAGFGLTMGIFFTAFMAVLLRAGTLRVPVSDRAEFLARLDRAAAKLRLRLIQKSDGTIVYEPKALLRTAAMHTSIEVAADEAVMTGPKMTLNSLKKEIDKP